MKTICLVLLLLSPALSWSADISVGGVSLVIPQPKEFSLVTSQMALLFEVQKQFVAHMNEEFVAFIPDRDVPAVLKDEIPDLPRRFTVQTAKSLIGVSVTTSDFSKLKNTIKSQNDEIIKRLEAQVPELMGKINDGFEEKYNVDLALSVSQMIPMPVHEETERTLSYSSLVKYEIKDEHGNPAPFVAVVTATFVHVKSKILFLYSYAEESGLEWSKEASRKWTDDVVMANPSDFKATVKEAIPSSVSGVDWGEVGAKAVVGAIIGLVIGLVGWLRNRGKTS
jgi:hypothetical protein